MFASKSERKVHYSIRKFSIGVASVVVASLFLGGVVHAEGVSIRNNSTVTSSGEDISKKYAMKSIRIIKVYWRMSIKIWKKFNIPKMSAYSQS